MTTTPAAGWYPDPSGVVGTNRWWDGTTWTDRTQLAPPPPFPPPRVPSPAGPLLANYGARLGGWLLDWLIVGIVTTPLLLAFGAIDRTSTMVNANGSVIHTTGFWVGPRGFVIHGLVVLLYGTLFCGSGRGQTIGMMAAGTRAVDIASGASIGYARAFGRALLEYVLFIAFFLPWVIDMLFPLWDPMNQTLHDKATRTIVIRPSLPWAPGP